MNVYDSNRILDLFKNKNYEKVEDPKDANLVVLNTCHTVSYTHLRAHET